MRLTRRVFASLAAAAAIVPADMPAARADETDPRLSDRALGAETAPVTVLEFFSMTCTHCAAFSKDSMPQIRKDLIDQGKVRYVYRDFPLDRLALIAAAVARTLPAERYVAFTDSLLASQAKWAFARNVNNTDELFKRAALAGMTREAFDGVLADDAFLSAILARQNADQTTYSIEATPTFAVLGRDGARKTTVSGELTPDAFAKLVSDATPS